MLIWKSITTALLVAVSNCLGKGQWNLEPTRQSWETFSTPTLFLILFPSHPCWWSKTCVWVTFHMMKAAAGTSFTPLWPRSVVVTSSLVHTCNYQTHAGTCCTPVFCWKKCCQPVHGKVSVALPWCCEGEGPGTESLCNHCHSLHKQWRADARELKQHRASKERKPASCYCCDIHM